MLLTAFFNAQSGLWYELFSSWMGKGDKETFAYAFEATRTAYSVVATPVGSVGIMNQVGRPSVHTSENDAEQGDSPARPAASWPPQGSVGIMNQVGRPSA